MDKVREYKFDNLKFVLIFLVVFAHLLEMCHGRTKEIVYIIIYTFHMPMFVYISGYFSSGKKKNILKLIYIYFIWQTLYFLIDRFLLHTNITLNYFYPNWILWYIFSLVVWNLLVYTKPFKDKSPQFCFGIIIFTFFVSLFSGYIDFIGYDFSASRIITFLPYFLLGYFQRNNGLNLFELSNKKHIRTMLIYSLLALCSLLYFLYVAPSINSIWLYGSYSYAIAGYTIVFKLMWILLSISELFLLYNAISSKQLPIVSTLGSNTLVIYLVHGIFIKCLKRFSVNVFTSNELMNIIICFILTTVMVILLGNNFINRKLRILLVPPKILQQKKWRYRLYLHFFLHFTFF